MKNKIIICLLGLVATTLPSHAHVYFNTSQGAPQTGGWTGWNLQNGATIQNFTGYYRCTCRFNANSKTRFHCEPHKSAVAKQGVTRYFTQQFRLPSAFWNNTGKNHVIGQLASDQGAWAGWGISNGALYGIAMSMDTWHQLTVQFDFTTSGARRSWVDGVQVASVTGVNNWPWTGTVVPRWSVGLYEPNWHNAAAPTGGLTTRSVDKMHCKIASNYADAQP